MDNAGWLKVRTNFVYLRNNLVAEDLAPHLYQDMAISEEDLDKIEAESTPQKKSGRLLFIMKCKEDGYQKLCKGLSLTQSFLVNILESTTVIDNTGEDRIKSQLLETFCECNGACVKVGDVKEAIKHTISPNFGDNDLIQKVKSAFPTANMDLYPFQTFEIKNITKRLPDEGLNLEADPHVFVSQSLQLMDVEDLCRTLTDKIKSERILKLSLLDTFRKQNISGKVFFHMTPEEFEKIQPDMTFGEQKILFLIRDKMINEENVQMNQTAHEHVESVTPRPRSETNSEKDDCKIVSMESPSINQNIVKESKETPEAKKHKRRADRSIASSVPEKNKFKKSSSDPSLSSYRSIQHYFHKIRK